MQCHAIQCNARQDGARLAQDGAKMAQEERRKKEEGRKKTEERERRKKKTNLYTLTPDHPALLAPYYIIYNI